MEDDPQAPLVPAAAASRRRTVLAITGVVVLVGALFAVGLAARGGGHGSNDNTAVAHLRAGNDGDGSKATTTVRRPVSSVTKPRPRGASASTTVPRNHGSASSTAPNRSTPTSTPGTTVRSTPGVKPPPGGIGKYNIPTKPPPAAPSFVQAYTTAFRAECESIWSIATSDGELWDPDEDQPRTPHKINECLGVLNPLNAGYAFDLADATQNGTSDAMDAASQLTWFGVLQNTPGTQKWVDPEWARG
jgi:hypothetical protein